MALDLATKHSARTFLVVVDESDELNKALLYACRRAEINNGDVALLFVLDPVEFQHWVSVGEIMKEEQREMAQQKIDVFSAIVRNRIGRDPKVFIKEGDKVEQILLTLEEEPYITSLVLGAAPSEEGPGPIVTQLMGKLVGKLHVPLIMVPGNLDDDEILKIT